VSESVWALFLKLDQPLFNGGNHFLPLLLIYLRLMLLELGKAGRQIHLEPVFVSNASIRAASSTISIARR
jgi:hypothetical protein